MVPCMMGTKLGQWLRVLALFASALLLVGCATTGRPHKNETPSSLSVVEQYLAALNRRDLLMLTAYVTPDVEWYSIVDGKRILEVAGRVELAQMLTRYFEQHQRTQWVIEQSSVAQNVLAVTERSEWSEGGPTNSRTSLGVYELHDGRIRRMTYFLPVQ